MATREVSVSLGAAGVAETRAPGLLREFTVADRVMRAALVMAGAVVLAGALIPIPIIHLLGIPLVLITGIVLAARQLAAVARLRPLRIACPKCGAANRVGGGFGYRSVAGEFERACESCRRRLTMRIADR
jgi:hypothetical protein